MDAQAVCARHPDRLSVGECSRCGDFHCEPCRKLLLGRSLCEACRALPGVDYLEETRRLYWGKRDGFVWFLGLFSVLVSLAVMPSTIERRDWISLAMGVPSIAISLGYLMLLPWARIAMLASAVLFTGVGVIRTALGDIPGVTDAEQQAVGGTAAILGVMIGMMLANVLIVVAAHLSPRNRLAFQLPTTDSQLQTVWDTYRSNPMARRAFWYGLIAVLFPLASFITLAFGIIAYRKADPNAWPPRGGRRLSVAAIVISLLGVGLWGSAFAAAVVFT
jgi:hypothetical protein